MSVLKFRLTPEATAKVHDILLCLAKFGESVSIEARSDKVYTVSQTSQRLKIIYIRLLIPLIALFYHSQFVSDIIRFVIIRSQHFLLIV